MKKKELKPKDSIPKMHIISNRGSTNKGSNKCMKFNRSNVNVMDEDIDQNSDGVLSIEEIKKGVEESKFGEKVKILQNYLRKWIL